MRTLDIEELIIMGTSFKWDGEKIVQTVDEEKHTPREILMALDSVRGQLAQMRASEDKLNQQFKQLKLNVEKATKDETKLTEFEPKCIELQKAKILSVIDQIHKECMEKAQKDADAEIAKAPDAYVEQQIANLPYLNYQKAIATHEKMNKKVAPRMIREFLYGEPVFANPFKTEPVAETPQ